METTAAKVDDGGLAFPCPHGDSCEWHHGQSGMSLRDYFAAAALTGMLSNSYGIRRNGEPLNGREDFADSAYAVADAMLAARVPPAAGEGETSR